ncbi:putative O-methylsterigmatocystin oxidoreductase [Trichoderma sp. SZMC 28015]
MILLPVAVAFLVCLWIFHKIRSTNGKRLPPGPRQLPLIGNLHQAPQNNPWRTYQQWSTIYGPIFRLQYGLNTVIILGNYEAAHDLLDKRSNIYSSRPRSVMGGENVSKGMRTLLMPYGQQWRTHQRLQASYLNIRVSQTYRELQDVESKQLLCELLVPGVDFSDRYHRYSSSLIFALAYGRRLETGSEPEVKAIDKVMENFLYAARVGTWIVDSLPFLNYLPNLLAPWKVHGDQVHEFESSLYMGNMRRGKRTKSWNWSKQVSEMKESNGMTEKELAYDVGIIYEAGSDTTTMALEVFTLAMILNPDVMKKAQKEIDENAKGLPSFEDKDNLPYVDALIKETLRWRPVSAGGIPHAVTQDDVYMGFHIPKGATVIGNHWSIHLDKDVYKDPHNFTPDRWIEDPTLPLAPFGFGRRVCTGQHIARNSLFINIARILWAFDINYAYEENEDGEKRCEVDPWAFTQGFNSRPLPFRASFTLRSEEKATVIREEWDAADKDLDQILTRIRSSQRAR